MSNSMRRKLNYFEYISLIYVVVKIMRIWNIKVWNLYFIEQLYKINPDRLIIINPKTSSGK